MKERYLNILKSIPGKKVGVIGDFIADEYLLGMTSRVSREAPVLILKYDSSNISLGGGANAVNNVKALGGEVYPISIVGNDDKGKAIVTILKEKGIATDGIISSQKRVTATKTRILAGGQNTTKQQVIRIDKEDDTPIDITLEDQLLSIINRKVDELDAIIVSDYSLGNITDRIINKINEVARDKGKVVTVDSRFNLLKFKWMTAVTPNTEELEWVLKDMSLPLGDINAGGNAILKAIEAKGILHTRGKEGMTLFEASGDVTDIDIYGTDEIADVTGAGDTVISAFTLALAAGATMIEAAQIANYAGGIVVMKSGTAVVRIEEIEKGINEDER